MLTFITSLRHPHNCHSYERVCKLLDRTLNSVCAQSDPDFTVIVVCNKIPDISEWPKVHYVPVDFPPPSDKRAPETGMGAIRLDRGSKYLIGLIYAQRFAPDHIMFFDADDYVSRELAGFVNSQNNANGWYLDKGYVYKERAYTISLLKWGFYMRCGTSSIVNFRHFRYSSRLHVDSPLEDIVQETDSEYLNLVLGSHKFVKKNYHKQDLPLAKLSWPGAVWVLGNGENHSGHQGIVGSRALSDQIRHEFNMPAPGGWPRLHIRKELILRSLLDRYSKSPKLPGLE